MGAEAFLSEQVIGLSESIDDRVAALLQAGTGITLTYNDAAGTLTIASTVSPAWGSIGGTLSNQTDLQTALNAKMGGSTGATDNRILRADGTGGSTVQNSAVTIDDSGNISGLGTVACGAITASGTLTSPNIAAGAGGIFSPYQLTVNGNAFFRFPNGSGNRAFVGRLADWLGSGTSQNFCFSSYQPEIHFFTNDQYVDGQQALVLSSTTATTNKNLVINGLTRVGVYTVATLPSAAANAGALAQVTDSSVTTNGSAVSGSGSNRVVVFSNGSTWDVVVA